MLTLWHRARLPGEIFTPVSPHTKHAHVQILELFYGNPVREPHCGPGQWKSGRLANEFFNDQTVCAPVKLIKRFVRPKLHQWNWCGVNFFHLSTFLALSSINGFDQKIRLASARHWIMHFQNIPNARYCYAFSKCPKRALLDYAFSKHPKRALQDRGFLRRTNGLIV